MNRTLATIGVVAAVAATLFAAGAVCAPAVARAGGDGDGQGQGQGQGQGPVPGARVMVWPGAPDTPVAEAERALADAGYRVLRFAPVEDRLRAHGAEAERREVAVLGDVEQALGEARRAFLDQRFADMIAVLSALELRALEVLARPQHIPVLWELCFQLGLGFHARAQEGDDARAQARFLLALTLEPDRRPLRELYGPEVAAAFARALSERDATPPRPVAIRTTPADARVQVDGVPLLRPGHAGPGGGARAPGLRPGLHVIRVDAPGFEPVARLVSVAGQAEREIEIALPARDAADPVDRIGAAWAQGALHASTGSGRRAMIAAAGAAGARLVLVVALDRATGQTGARLLSEAHAEPPVWRRSAAEAVRAALAARAGGIHAGAPGGSPSGAASRGAGATATGGWWTRWWVWTGAGVVAATAGVVLAGAALGSDVRRVQVFAPGR